MFEYLDRDNHENGSQDRYDARPRHRLWWLIHNCVAHPLIGILPYKPFFDFHDYTSAKINACSHEWAYDGNGDYRCKKCEITA